MLPAAVGALSRHAAQKTSFFPGFAPTRVRRRRAIGKAHAIVAAMPPDGRPNVARQQHSAARRRREYPAGGRDHDSGENPQLSQALPRFVRNDSGSFKNPWAARDLLNVGWKCSTMGGHGDLEPERHHPYDIRMM
jgi:hypothetical protein